MNFLKECIEVLMLMILIATVLYYWTTVLRANRNLIVENLKKSHSSLNFWGILKNILVKNKKDMN